MTLLSHESSPTVSIRAAALSDAAAIAAVHVASWRETYSGLMPETMLRGLSVSHRTERWARILDHALAHGDASVFVAERDGDLVGFASGGGQREQAFFAAGFTGEISAIYVLGNAQGRGVGRCLMVAVALTLHEQGRQGGSLWELRENQPARRFYERLGGEVIGEREDRREAVTLFEVAYGWRDLSVMAGSPSAAPPKRSD
jgi:ribosomal protein S18 acetylase RimI-like enzyme